MTRKEKPKDGDPWAFDSDSIYRMLSIYLR